MTFNSIIYTFIVLVNIIYTQDNQKLSLQTNILPKKQSQVVDYTEVLQSYVYIGTEQEEAEHQNIEIDNLQDKQHFFYKKYSPQTFDIDIKFNEGNEKKLEKFCQKENRYVNHTLVQTHPVLLRYHLKFTVLNQYAYTLSKNNMKSQYTHNYMNITQYTIIKNEEGQYNLHEKERIDLILNFQDQIKEILGEDLDEVEQIVENMQMVTHQESNTIYLVDKNFIFSFTPNTENFEKTILFNNSNYNKRPDIHKVRIFSNLLFVSAGSEGLDIYQIDNNSGRIQFLQAIQDEDFEREAVDIQDISYYNKQLMILGRQGLFFFDNTNLQIPMIKNPFFIPIEGGVMFDHYEKSSFLIVTEVKNDIMSNIFIKQNVTEIHVNWNYEMPRYYINRGIPVINEVLEIKMTKQVGIIVALEVIDLVYHGIYKEFTKDIFEKKQDDNYDGYQDLDEILERMQIQNFKQFQLIDPLQDGTIHSLMIGLQDKGIVLTPLNLIPVQLICQNPEEFKENETVKFQVVTHSTTCEKEQNQNQLKNDDFFTMCKLTQTINLSFKDEFIEYEQAQNQLDNESSWVQMLIFGGIIMIAIGSVFIFVKKIIRNSLQNYQSKVNQLEMQVQNLKQYEHKFKALSQDQEQFTEK